MKLFFKYILSVLFVAFISLIIADIAYTYVYSNTVRNKFQFLRSYKNKNVDYIFLGSSRVENGLNPKVIDSVLNKNTVNFGVQAAGVLDLKLMLELIKDYNITSECIYIQMDYIYNLPQKQSNVLEYQLVPFIRESNYINNYYNSKEYSLLLKYIPFIRYSMYDQKNGFREFVANCFNKSYQAKDTKGFSALYGVSEHQTHKLPEFIIKENKEFSALLDYIKSNNINVKFFCSPFRNDIKNLDYVEKLEVKIPDLINYSKSIQDKKLFKDNYHLNNFGAKVFSQNFRP